MDEKNEAGQEEYQFSSPERLKSFIVAYNSFVLSFYTPAPEGA